MALKNGLNLASYEIQSLLGSGGMGEVYRARDARLDRDVAIKVLPESLARDPERIARFQREAKLLASLSHPNIAAIHGFEEVAGTKFLVLEYVDGETLADRLKRGALPIDETLEIGKQIAEGLEIAHQNGVIHRDLKPGNVMIRPDGTVKVLDFGLAKAVSDELPSAVLANSPTITAHYTRPGMVLGTAAYMSPEQARGKMVDARTDIWSLGVLLYECLTGHCLFRGESASDSIGAILHKEIEFDRLPVLTPAVVRRLLHRCLHRDKNRRLQSAGDARIELEDTLRELESGLMDVGNGFHQRRAWILPSITFLLAVCLGLSLLQSSRRATSEIDSLSEPVAVVTEMVQLTDLPGMQVDPSISPDGRMLLYVAWDGHDLDIFLQRVGGENAINLTADSPADDYAPTFSPDGERIAFRSQREGGGLFIMGATGESPRRISDDGFDPAWSSDGGELIYSTENVEGPYNRSSVAQLWVVDVRSREKRLLTDGDAVGPSFSPSGRLVSYWAAIAGIRDIFIIPRDGGSPTPVTQDRATDWNPFFSPDGRTLYFLSDRSGSQDLWRIPVNPDTGVVLGPPIPVTAGVRSIDKAAIAADGRQIVFSAPLLLSQIERFEFDPQAGRVLSEPKTVFASTNVLHQFDVTPDGRRLVFRTGAPREDLVVMNLDGTGRRRLMDDVHRDRGPRWSRDGKWLLFYSNRGGLYDIWRIRPDGTDAFRLTATTGNDLTVAVVSPDERRFVTAVAIESEQAVASFALDRAVWEIESALSVPQPSQVGFSPWRYSPDGRRIAGQISNRDQSAAVCVYDVTSGKVARISAPDGGDMFISQYSGMDWLDENRLIVWDEKRDSAFMADVNTGTTHPLQGLQGPCDIRVVEGGKALVVNRLREESDIWMLRLSVVEDSEPRTVAVSP